MKDNTFYRSRIQIFDDAGRRFASKEIGPKEFKGISGGFGSYAQKGGELVMVRLRMCGGRVDKDKLNFIIDACERYGLDFVHTTTCETVQLHNLTCSQATEVMYEALDHGINTQGGGGDNPRNVSTTSLSGIEPGEFFDVYPYAKAVESYLLEIMTEIRLPRKLKVTFASSERNETHATFRDMGFVARPDGLFDIWTAGGLGGCPSMGILTAEAVNPRDVLYHVRAMVDTFIANGNYEDRSRSRTRHMRMDLGDDRYLEEYNSNLVRLLESVDLHIDPCAMDCPSKGSGSIPDGYPRVHPQKQGGLYYVTYRPVAGDVPIDVLRHIRDAIIDIPDTELRVSPDSAIHIINLDSEEAIRLSDVTEGGAMTVFESSVSCIGSTICQQGTRDSNGLLKAMVAAVRQAGIPDDSLPRFRISGCASSCGCHQVGVIGLQGASSSVDGSPVKVFKVTANGCGLRGHERFGDHIGDVLVDRVTDMVVHLGKVVSESGMSFDEWYSSNDGDFKSVLSQFLV